MKQQNQRWMSTNVVSYYYGLNLHYSISKIIERYMFSPIGNVEEMYSVQLLLFFFFLNFIIFIVIITIIIIIVIIIIIIIYCYNYILWLDKV